MDFSKVRLADFAQARLREVPAPREDKNTSEVKSNLSPSFTTGSGGLDVCAHAPQYTVSLFPLAREAALHTDMLENVELDVSSGYALAILSEGLLVWKQGADNSLLFPLSKDHHISAKLVPIAADSTSIQPGLVTVDRKSGYITYWDSVNRAVSSSSSIGAGDSNSGPIGSRVARVSLGHKELIQYVESVPPFGLVIATTSGHFYLVNLRDDMGKRNVQVHHMRAGNGILARLRSMGALSRDLVSICPGKMLHNESMREVFIANRYGDVALWHVGLNGLSELVDEIRVGSQLEMQMDMLYPNSQISLQVHGLTVEDKYIHVLASFAPESGRSLRYFVIMSLTREFDVVSVRRLLSYESQSGVVSDFTSLSVGNGVIVAACADAIILVDSPSRGSLLENGAMARWEESLALKPEATMLGSTINHDGTVTISTAMGALRFAFNDERAFESTTKARLEQAVFEASQQNPLDLKKWCSTFESLPDANAPKQLALEIANSQTPYVPAQLPELLAHLELRISKLQDLYKQAPLTEVCEIAQSLVAGTALYSFYEAHQDSNIKNIIEAAVKASGVVTIRELLLHQILKVPEILNSIVSSSSNLPDMAQLILFVYEACVKDGLGLPKWATQGHLRQALESLTSQAVEAKDAELLASTTEILCAVYADPQGSQETKSGTIKQLLYEVSQFNGMTGRAISIARKYRVYSALAPLEVGEWLNSAHDQSNGLEKVSEHISELGETYANAVFETCVTSGNTRALVKDLAILFPDLVSNYLDSNELPGIAWTLSPGSAESTQQLKRATEEAQTLDARRIYASLYKISAFTTGTGDVAEAQRELDLVAAQESLKHQLNADAVVSSPLLSGSSLVNHGLEHINKILDYPTAVDLLSLAPPQAIPESNMNFVWGFRLVDPKDVVRQRLLVQQLVCNTNWDRVLSANSSTQGKRLRQTLFYHTLQHVPKAYKDLLYSFLPSLVAPDRDAVRQSYPWDLSDSVFQELEKIYERTRSIVDKYQVKQLLNRLNEEHMEVDF